ncbi:MAG: imidazoleglycerol-phosphate dehydratase HisB [Acidimicrobiia bacterium]
MKRTATLARQTKETNITLTLTLEGTGTSSIATGIPFFDHMLEQLSRHSAVDLELSASGDLEVDTHHTVEDVGIALGQAFAQALGDKRGVMRFADALVPLDEALVQVALDLSGRPFLAYNLKPTAEFIGTFDPQLAEEFWRAIATAGGWTLHIRELESKNAHHLIEASFKAVAQCLRRAIRIENEGGSIPSTKGAL